MKANATLVLASYNKETQEVLYTFDLTIPKHSGLMRKVCERIYKALIWLDIPTRWELARTVRYTGPEEEVSDALEKLARMSFVTGQFAPALYLKMCEHFNFTTDLFDRISGKSKVPISVAVIQRAAELYGKEMNNVFKVLSGTQQHEDFLAKAA